MNEVIANCQLPISNLGEEVQRKLAIGNGQLEMNYGNID